MDPILVRIYSQAPIESRLRLAKAYPCLLLFRRTVDHLITERVKSMKLPQYTLKYNGHIIGGSFKAYTTDVPFGDGKRYVFSLLEPISKTTRRSSEPHFIVELERQSSYVPGVISICLMPIYRHV